MRKDESVMLEGVTGVKRAPGFWTFDLGATIVKKTPMGYSYLKNSTVTNYPLSEWSILYSSPTAVLTAVWDYFNDVDIRYRMFEEVGPYFIPSMKIFGRNFDWNYISNCLVYKHTNEGSFLTISIKKINQWSFIIDSSSGYSETSPRLYENLSEAAAALEDFFENEFFEKEDVPKELFDIAYEMTGVKRPAKKEEFKIGNCDLRLSTSFGGYRMLAEGDSEYDSLFLVKYMGTPREGWGFLYTTGTPSSCGISWMRQGYATKEDAFEGLVEFVKNRGSTCDEEERQKVFELTGLEEFKPEGVTAQARIKRICLEVHSFGEKYDWLVITPNTIAITPKDSAEPQPTRFVTVSINKKPHLHYFDNNGEHFAMTHTGGWSNSKIIDAAITWIENGETA